MRQVALITLALAAACSDQQQDIRSTITPEAIATTTEPVLFIELPQSGQQAIMSLTGVNGAVLTWSTADGRSISLAEGVLVATRGFGEDLISADVTGTLSALAGGPRVYEKFASFLNGENKVIIRSYSCTMTGPLTETIDSFGRTILTSRWNEICRSVAGESHSDFWQTADGTWRADQSFGPSSRPIILERLTNH